MLTMKLILYLTLSITVWSFPKIPHIEESIEIDSDELQQQGRAKVLNCSCGWTNKVRIVGGKQTDKNEFPSMSGVALKSTMIAFGGATIITNYHAITAAHITLPFKGEQLVLIIGAHNISSTNDKTTELIEIKETIEHENYSRKTYHNDIALMILARPINFTQFVGPACLPAENFLLENESVKVLGWGRMKYKGDTSDTLMKVDLKVISISNCAKKYMRKIIIDKPTQLCILGDKKDSCQGDSGGPVIWLDPEINRFTLVGLVSYGKICGTKTPSLNTKIGVFISWIQEKIASTGLPGQTCSKV